MSSPLPLSCAACIFKRRRPEDLACHRHAPGPGLEEDQPVYWPIVVADDRCGEGATQANPDKGIELVQCDKCRYWQSPSGGVKPALRRYHPESWWRDAGWCRRYAPGPSTEEYIDRTHWRVTHYTEGCGNGKRVDAKAEA